MIEFGWNAVRLVSEAMADLQRGRGRDEPPPVACRWHGIVDPAFRLALERRVEIPQDAVDVDGLDERSVVRAVVPIQDVNDSQARLTEHAGRRGDADDHRPGEHDP